MNSSGSWNYSGVLEGPLQWSWATEVQLVVRGPRAASAEEFGIVSQSHDFLGIELMRREGALAHLMGRNVLAVATAIS
jgi:hypothetical protein